MQDIQFSGGWKMARQEDNPQGESTLWLNPHAMAGKRLWHFQHLKVQNFCQWALGTYQLQALMRVDCQITVHVGRSRGPRPPPTPAHQPCRGHQGVDPPAKLSFSMTAAPANILTQCHGDALSQNHPASCSRVPDAQRLWRIKMCVTVLSCYVLGVICYPAKDN